MLETFFPGYLIFNSFSFLVYFVIVVALYFVLPYKYRWFMLLVASCYFYMSFIPIYVLILGFTIVVDYFAGLLIERSKGKKRTAFLVLSILANVGILAVFKYYNFINENLSFLLTPLGVDLSIPYLSILLPIGLSFHTFQAMSYTIEVYKGRQKAERHFGLYALYVMFFPQLVAGPIERPQNLLPQFKKKHDFEWTRVSDGLKLMLWGLFKKVVIADRLAILVDTVYASPDAYQGLPLIIATVAFAIQIYCDFSGYTDIAIGAAQVLGIRLMENFRRPYYAKSVGDFWKRWHISLSTWFRDYVYIPLGGSRVAVPRMYINILIVFLLSGLWHGASWTFVIWGAIHGAYLIFGRITWPFREKVKEKVGLKKVKWLDNAIKTLITFVLVTFAWIFFRANSLKDAIYVVTHLFSNLGAGLAGVNLGLDWTEIIIAIVAIGFMELVHVIQEHSGMRHFLSNKPRWLRWAVYIAVILLILLFGVFQRRQFIYFQF